MIDIPEQYNKLLKLQRTGAKDYIRTQEQAIEDTKYDTSKILEIKSNGDYIIDIGCGLGLMMSHLTDEFKNIHLVDKTLLETDKKLYSYNRSVETFGFYNDLEFAERLVNKNTKATVKTFEPENLPNDIKYDAIVSFYSWGFHYPLDTYADWAISSLNKDGVIVITARDKLVDENLKYFKNKGLEVGLIETRQACGLIYARQT